MAEDGAGALAIGALAGILGVLSGTDAVPAGTAAGRPPLDPTPALLFGLPMLTVVTAAVVGLVVLLILRK